MPGSPLVEMQQVYKRFCRNPAFAVRYGLADIARDLAGFSGDVHKLRRDEFWAVRDVSLEAHRGEVVAFIGHNGSGKSTLLKMIAGIYHPDRGEVRVRGRVGSLIELGAGFHPMLSGLENIHVNAAILGVSRKRLRKQLDRIIEFSGVDPAQLQTPIRMYSPGMQARLGFSIAAHSDPDILLVDEVMSVGDLDFRARCEDRLRHMRQSCLIVLVSHNQETVARLCDRVILFGDGTRLGEGSVADMHALYDRHRQAQARASTHDTPASP